MRRRKFLTWIASLPIVAAFFQKLWAKVKKPKPKKPKTTEELKEICREILQRHLTSKFSCPCSVIVRESSFDKQRLTFTSLLSNGIKLDTSLKDIADGMWMMADESKMKDLEVRILSIDRIDLMERKHDEQPWFPLSLDTLEVSVKEDGSWLILKWDIETDGFLNSPDCLTHDDPMTYPLSFKKTKKST